MGDRANVKVVDLGFDAGVYLYSHWGGSELPCRLQEALQKRWRWNDASYLARIIFDAMTERRHGEETGYGISSRLTDNEYKILVVSCRDKRVYAVPEDQVSDNDFSGCLSWSFEEFCSLDLGDDPWPIIDPNRCGD